MESLEVPSLFICPISLQIMKDPVTISTGMTFDRESIQKWLFSYKHITCPLTKQPLSDFTLIPNSNLLRLIESWKIQTPSEDHQRPCKNDSVIIILVEEMKKQPHLQMNSLKKIKTLLIGNKTLSISDRDVLFSSIASLIPKDDSSTMIIDETVSLLCLLKPSDETLKIVSENGNGNLIRSLCAIMIKYLYTQIRIQSALLLNSIFEVVDGVFKEELKPELFETMTEILKDQNSRKGTTAVLKILIQVLPIGRNKEKAIKGGLVPVVIELLAESNNERKCSEMMVVVLEIICRKAEGRAAFLGHPMGVAAVSAMILRNPVQYKAIDLLLQIVRVCKSNEVAQEFMEVGAVAKLLMVIQGVCDLKIKLKALKILGFLKGTWKYSPCLPYSVSNLSISN
ncbi:E3 ubiquitin-protein ligase PUB23-like [Euphorbia lathyris]|uniref:E3 ubiquitin-protein ligase PUB23-like n=1 Tax=Euphorbia lathyris TaxID=212925 RepID=UPI003313AA01